MLTLHVCGCVMLTLHMYGCVMLTLPVCGQMILLCIITAMSNFNLKKSPEKKIPWVKSLAFVSEKNKQKSSPKKSLEI